MTNKTLNIKITFSLKRLLIIALFASSYFGGFSQQTVSTTILYTGALAQGCGSCLSCNIDNWCINSSNCGSLAACDSRVFTDPVPAGNIITGVTITYFGAGCDATAEPTYINGVLIGSAPNDGDCSCGACSQYPTSNTYTCPVGLPNYHYGGSDTLKCCPNGAFCPQKAVITFTYVAVSVAATGITASANPSCGGAVTLHKTGGSLGTGASWKWYSGSCGGTSVGTGDSISVSPTTTTTYFVRAEGGGCGNTTCAQITITVNSPSVAPTSISATYDTICGGDSTTLSIVGGSLGAGASWKWYSGSCGGTLESSNSTLTISPSTNTTYFARAEGACGNTTCVSKAITVNATPVVQSITASDTICSGTATSIALSSSTQGTNFNWTVSQTGVSGGANGSGNTITQTLSVTGATQGTAIYTITPTANGCQGNIIYDTIIVNPTPVITALPATQTINSETFFSPISLNSSLTGTSFSWTVNETNTSGGASGTGSSISDSLISTGCGNGTAVYTINAAAYGCPASPVTATITVTYLIPTLTGGGSYCNASDSGTVTLSNYSGTILNWLQSTDGGTSWTSIANTSPTLSYTNITQSTIYTAVIQNGMICPLDTSTQAVFTILTQAVAGTINAPTAVCATANNGVLSLTGYTGTIISWQSSINNGTTWTFLPSTTDTLHYNNIAQEIWYRAIVQSGTCNADTSAIVSVVVSPATVAGTLTGGGVFCGATATGSLTLSGYTGTIISWISSTNNGTSWTTVANTTDTSSYNNITTTTSYAAIVQSGSCSADTSNIVIASVTPQTVAGTIASSDTVCTEANIDTLTLSGNVGNVLMWLFSTDNGLTWTSIANTNNELPYGGLTQSIQYAAVVQSGSCTADTTLPAIITVAPLPLVNAGNDTTLTSGESIVLNGSGTGTPLWVPPAGLDNATIFTPVASPETTTSYVIAVMDNNNCINMDTIVVTVIFKTFNGKPSNVLTPNGDGVNDSWYVEGIENYPDNKVYIYNIYGLEVYKAEGYLNDWKGTYNGSSLPNGTYYYVIRFDTEDITLRGSVDILSGK